MTTTACDILLVDDDSDLLRLLSLRLGAAGYTVATAASGEAALARLTTLHPRLLITDLRMDGMDGMALFQTVQQQRPALPVIILTAHGTIPDAVTATRAGAFGFVSKPFDSRDLLEQVRTALELAAPRVQSEGTRTDWRREILTRSTRLESVLDEAWRVAQTEASVLIVGESGTGKELLARAVHWASARREQPFVAVNCSAIPGELLESELFGHSRGAFTGALSSHKGLFQAADGGTLFLDEIGDMPPALQAKLLRALQERQVRPVGSTQSVAVDVRIVSATLHDLEALMQRSAFREDLFYRLNVVSLTLLPLRERREDIPLLANHFLRQLAARNKRNVKAFAPAAMELLIGADWPGNVRQLYNVVEHCLVLASAAIIPRELVRKALRDRTGVLPSLNEARAGFEREYLMNLLQLTSGNVARAARLAKRNRTDFYKLLSRHGLDPAVFKSAGGQ